MAEYNPSKIIKDGNTYNFRDTTKIPLSGSNQISGDLIPATDNSIDIGSSTKNIKMLYTKGITINGTQFLPSDYATLSGLATVATSGSYNDLSNKPTIPTVNDATLTIQQNGTTVDSFSANSSSNKTVNIQCVDLTNNQTVGGIKTFSNAPVVGSINLDGKTIDTDANDNMTYDGHIVDTIEEQGTGYIRYSNGIQICWGRGSWQSDCTRQWGALYETSSINMSYAKSFVEPPSVSILGNMGDSAAIIESRAGNETTAPEVWLCRAAPASEIVTCNAYYIAIGRWK